jgi:hypothetical protein
VNRRAFRFPGPAAVAAALVLLILPQGSAALAEEAVGAPVLPPDVAEHFRARGVAVDPRQLPPEPGTAAAASTVAPAARTPLRVEAYARGTSATLATVPIGAKSYATAWLQGPGFRGAAIDRLTVVSPDGRATAELAEGKLKAVHDDRGQFVSFGRNGSRRTLTVSFNYGYARDRRVVDLPAAAATLLEGPRAGALANAGAANGPAEADGAAARSAAKRKVKLSVKACQHWPTSQRLIDAWIEINPRHKPDGRVAAFFPLERRFGTTFGATLDTGKLSEVRRDPAKVTASVGAAAEDVCDVAGAAKSRDVCTALGGEQAASIACRSILAPFREALCPAVKEASGWKPLSADEQTNLFEKTFEVRFSARFLSPYGYAWVSSTEPKKYGPKSDVIEGKLELPCWDVYQAPVKMTGSYQWPTCWSPYAEANATVQFANYMKGWYAWAGLSNWRLSVFQTQDCLSRNYVEGPFTPAGGAKLDGGYAYWKFSNAKWGGPDNYEAHINFAGDKMWGNVKDSRRSRKTSERATLYGEFSGRRAR